MRRFIVTAMVNGDEAAAAAAAEDLVVKEVRHQMYEITFCDAPAAKPPPPRFLTRNSNNNNNNNNRSKKSSARDEKKPKHKRSRQSSVVVVGENTSKTKAAAAEQGSGEKDNAVGSGGGLRRKKSFNFKQRLDWKGRKKSKGENCQFTNSVIAKLLYATSNCEFVLYVLYMKVWPRLIESFTYYCTGVDMSLVV